MKNICAKLESAPCLTHKLKHTNKMKDCYESWILNKTSEISNGDPSEHKIQITIHSQSKHCIIWHTDWDWNLWVPNYRMQGLELSTAPSIPMLFAKNSQSALTVVSNQIHFFFFWTSCSIYHIMHTHMQKEDLNFILVVCTEMQPLVFQEHKHVCMATPSIWSTNSSLV